jgi:hypothetical protein
MWDLTIGVAHDFYVVMPGAAILVHNCGGESSAATEDQTVEGRRGAFNEAKQQIGVPRSEQPTSVGPAYDRAGNPIPGSRVYQFGEGPEDPYITNHPPTAYGDGGPDQLGHFHPNAPGGPPHIFYGG